MGADLYRIKYEDTPIPRNYELYEWLSDKFGEEYGSRIFVTDIEELDEAIEVLKEKEKDRYDMIKDDLELLREYIKKEDGTDLIVSW